MGIITNNQVVLYTVFRDNLFNPDFVLYPCCGIDSSPAAVFKNVTFVDIRNDCIEVLQRAGYNAIASDIRIYRSEVLHDLLILLNPTISFEYASGHLRQGGFVIANDYSRTATNMFGHPEQFELIGKLDWTPEYEGVFSRDTSGLFVPVERLEELKEFRGSYFDFVKNSIPFLLKTEGIEPSKNLEEMYLQYQDYMELPRVLPAKNIAERYIFVKK